MKPFKMLGEYKKYHNGMAGVEKWETTCANSSLLISPKFQYEANWNNFLPKFFFFLSEFYKGKVMFYSLKKKVTRKDIQLFGPSKWNLIKNIRILRKEVLSIFSWEQGDTWKNNNVLCLYKIIL